MRTWTASLPLNQTIFGWHDRCPLRRRALDTSEGDLKMKTLVSLLVGGVLLFGSLALGTQSVSARQPDQNNNAQNRRDRDRNDNNNNRRRHRRRHHRRHRRHRMHHVDKLSY
jgi:hypothetical protein